MDLYLPIFHTSCMSEVEASIVESGIGFRHLKIRIYFDFIEYTSEEIASAQTITVRGFLW